MEEITPNWKDAEFPFDELLGRAGITKADLARKLKITPRTVSAWHETPPGYAVAYLELLIEFNRART